MNTKKRSKTPKKKNPLTYAITPAFADEIKEYVDKVHDRTGLPINRIVSNLLLEAVRRAKKFCPKISENSENSEKTE